MARAGWGHGECSVYRWGLGKTEREPALPCREWLSYIKKKYIEALYLRRNQIKWFGVQKNENMYVLVTDSEEDMIVKESGTDRCWVIMGSRVSVVFHERKTSKQSVIKKAA